MKTNIHAKLQIPTPTLFFLLPAVGTAFLWVMSPNDISPLQGLLAFMLLCLPWWAYLQWKRGTQSELPLFSMIACMYWLYFAFPLFLGGRNAPGWRAAGHILSDEAITQTIAMALLGVFCLWLGMKSGIGRRWVPRNIPDIPADPSRWAYLRFILIAGSLVSTYETSPYLFGEGGRQILIIFQSIIPMVAFAILFRNYLRGNASQFDKILIAIFLGINFLVGMSSAWLGATVWLMVACGVIYTGERRQIPRLAIILVVVWGLFFQVGKMAGREKYWYGQEQGSKVERIALWVNESLTQWEAAFSDPTGEGLRDLAYQTLSRLSLLTQAANVLELTPAVVPYQYGRLYSYMAITLIPRFLWPEKPSVNEANQFYQVAYGLTPEGQLGNVSIAVGYLTEGYINFGWFGVVLIMYLMGIFFDFFQRAFLSETSGTLFRGIGVVILLNFLIIESQLAQCLGGIAQKIFLTLLVLLPIIRFRRRSEQIGGYSIQYEDESGRYWNPGAVPRI